MFSAPVRTPNVGAHLPTPMRQPHRHRTDVDVMTPHRDHIDVNVMMRCDVDVTVKPLTDTNRRCSGQWCVCGGVAGGRLDLTWEWGDPDRPQQPRATRRTRRPAGSPRPPGRSIQILFTGRHRPQTVGLGPSLWARTCGSVGPMSPAPSGPRSDPIANGKVRTVA